MRRYSRLGMLLVLLALLVKAASAAPPDQLDRPFKVFLVDTRADLELLANSVLGAGVRPPTWTFDLDANSKTFIADLWYDNEQLADQIFGAGVRPNDPANPDAIWIGATSTNASLVARNIRHDLEVAADAFFTSHKEIRPQEWRGAAPIYDCSRSIQNTVYLLDILYTTQIKTLDSASKYCQTVAAELDDRVLGLNLKVNPNLDQGAPDAVLAVRGDLERLADEKLGLNSRPSAWVGNKDRTSVSLIGDTFLDLENLATVLLNSNKRPAGWIGTVTNSPVLSARNLRHDLELLADVVMGPAQRPHGWQNEDPLQRCSPTVQNLVFIVQQNYGFTTNVDLKDSPDFCAQTEVAANNIAENPPVEEIKAKEDQKYVAESQYAFAYLDSAALQYMGQMPAGMKFRAWYRNYGDSTMMFVSGDNFAVWIDRRWTTMSPDVFNTLPTSKGVKPLTFCDASWCNGPGPTPTPTGAGPLQEIIQGATPPATISPNEISQQGKVQVSWNNIRVTYLLDKPDTRSAQVALEICAEEAQINCEPVVRVFDNATGTNRPVLSQYNGLNVYEFPYGYTANLIIEGATRFSPDIWISDPTLR